MFSMAPSLMRNFFSKKATRRYPQVARPPFADARGELTNDAALCTFCGVCAAKCPSQCIRVDKKSVSWQYDPFACIYCGICVENCKAKSLRMYPHYRPPTVVHEIIVLHGKAPGAVSRKD